nr:peroxisomal membrane protein PEX14 isoform X1 [Leptinotarsa decemlineata]
MDSSPEESPVDIPPVRDEMVQTAIKFLQNPNVINTPLAQKQKFLQRKGLTDKEIQLACEKSGSYERYEEQNRLPPPLPLTPSPASNHFYRNQTQLSIFSRIRDVIQNVALFSIAAYLIHKFYMRYIAPFLFGKKKKSIEESIEELDKNVKSTVGQLKDELESVKVEIGKRNTEEVTSRQFNDLKSEISSVKGLLLSRKQFPSVANIPVVPPSIPAWQMSSVAPDHNDEQDVDPEGRKEDLLEDLGSGSGSSEPEHGMKTSESSLEIIYSRDCDSESCHSRKSNKDDIDKD